MKLKQSWLVALMDEATQTHNILACALIIMLKLLFTVEEKVNQTSSCILAIQLVLVTDKDHVFW